MPTSKVVATKAAKQLKKGKTKDERSVAGSDLEQAKRKRKKK
jgi:hypothetical protein